MSTTIKWTGKSGRSYTYDVYPIGTPLPSVPGNYVFATQLSNGNFRPIYAGETSDLSERFDNHHKMLCIKQNGATHITVHAHNDGKLARQTEENDIKAHHRPVCNG